MEFVKGAGFDFTKEEINSLKDELTAGELDVVTGGKVRCISLGWVEEYMYA